MKKQSLSNGIDWLCVSIYIILVCLGWMNIYSSLLSSATADASFFDMTQAYGKQLFFIIFSVPLIMVVLFTDSRIYEKFASIFFILSLVLIAGLFVFGKTIKGQTNWYSLGGFSLQPSEFAKAATALALAKYLGDVQVNLKNTANQIKAFTILFLPILLIVPHDPGSALIYTVLVLVLYREGLSGWYLVVAGLAVLFFILALVFPVPYIIGTVAAILALNYYFSKKTSRNLITTAIFLVLISGYTLSVSYVFDNVFKQHHRDRFNILLGKSVDLQKIGYNINQSKIAVGSGGWFGKGYLEGTQTKGGFVPEQHTDYIFTTVGEEWGFVGSVVVLSLFIGLILRILYLSERQKTKFSRVYGYCVASILFMHVFVNIAMVLGVFPTIGVPLPFFSYGGSGLWGFTILLFIFLKLDANKVNEW